MPTYYCFKGAPDRGGHLYGHEAQVLYIRDYSRDRRSGRFVPLVVEGETLGYCRTHGVVPVKDTRNCWSEDRREARHGV